MSESSKKMRRSKVTTLCAVMTAVHLVLWVVEAMGGYGQHSLALIFCYAWGLALLVLYWDVYYERGRGRWMASVGLMLLTATAVWAVILRRAPFRYFGDVLWISNSVTYWVRFAEDVVCVAGYLVFMVDAFLQYRLRKLSRVMSLVLVSVMVLRYVVDWLLGESGLVYQGLDLFAPLWWQMVIKLLLYGSFVAFFFGTAERPVHLRTPCHATVSDRRISDGETPPPRK